MDPCFERLHPDLAAWCATRLPEPTLPQRRAVPLGLQRANVLIASPTGTGKTLAAFLPVISGLAKRRDADELFARTYVLYVSPLRALGYDVEHNVRRPMREIGLLERPNSPRAARRRGRIREQFARTGVRTGDTPREERRLMLARPPHILVTTPESLAVMLAMNAFRKRLRTVETVIVDEIHALAGNKRGSQLALLLESLEDLVQAPFNRVGLSATIAPLDRVAQFLVGANRPCEIVDARGLRTIAIDVCAPFAGAMAPLTSIARTAARLSSVERTTLVFTNVRSQAERVAHEISASAGEDARVGVHHSALHRSVRHGVETALRAGELQTVVCSSSLELGVDVGYIDRVLVVGGARGMTPALQRIGRAGHRPNAVARGTVLAQDRDDVIEAAATKRCIADGVLEEAAIPVAPLDVLAQWIVGSLCPDRRFPIDELWHIARRAFPYANLLREDVVRCAHYLSGGGVGPDEAHARRIGLEGDAVFGLGRDACEAFFDNVGTIPNEPHVAVRIKGGHEIGRVEESFVNEVREGDVFVLNGKTLRVTEIDAAGMAVEPYAGRPTVPQWSSQLRGIPAALAREIHTLRNGVAQLLRQCEDRQEALHWLHARYGLERLEAAHVVRYIAQQMALSQVPSERCPVIEIYRMDRRQTAVFHTGAGRRINETLARAAAARLHAHARINSTLTTDDGGFMLALPAGRTLGDAIWPTLLSPEHFDRDLLAGLRSSHMLRNHFRHVAHTGLLVLRRVHGRSLRRGPLSWNAQKIFDRVYAADRRFPLVRETFRTVTRDVLDAPGARDYLSNLEGEPRVIHPPAATPFTFGILTSSFGDSVMLDDRAEMVEALHRRVLEVLGEPEALPV